MSTATRSDIIWLIIATIAIVELLATFGVRTILRLGNLLATYDWLPIGLTLSAKISPLPSAVVSGLILPFVFVICFVTVVSFSQGTDYRAVELSKPEVAASTFYLFLLYCLFVLPWGGLNGILADISRAILLNAYLNLLAVAVSFGVLFPFLAGMSYDSNHPRAYSLRQSGILSGAAYLFAGGLAVLASIDWIIAVITLFVSMHHYSGSSRLLRIAPEENLISSLSLVRVNSLGFGIFYCIITGLVLTAELAGMAEFNSIQVIYPIFWDIYPRLTLLTLVVLLVIVGASFGLLVGLLRIPRLKRSGPIIAIALMIALWVISAGLTVMSAFSDSSGRYWHSIIHMSIRPSWQLG